MVAARHLLPQIKDRASLIVDSFSFLTIWLLDLFTQSTSFTKFSRSRSFISHSHLISVVKYIINVLFHLGASSLVDFLKFYSLRTGKVRERCILTGAWLCCSLVKTPILIHEVLFVSAENGLTNVSVCRVEILVQIVFAVVEIWRRRLEL